MGVSGLADGFLAGFGTMDNYYRGKRADERADKDISLREAAIQYGKERDAKADEWKDKEWANKLERQQVGDKQREQTRQDSLRQWDIQNRNSAAHLGLAQAQSARAAELHKLTMESNKKASWWEENGLGFNTAVEAVTSGKPLTSDQAAILNHPNAQSRSPFRFLGGETQGAAIAVGEHLQNVIGRAGEINSYQQLKDEINTPEATKNMMVMLRGDLEKGLKTTKPNQENQGKQVAGYNDVNIVPNGRGGYYIAANVTYNDGTTAWAPITENRSTNGSDVVMEFSQEQLINYFGKSAQIARWAKDNPEAVEQYLVGIGMKPAFDEKGYNKEMSAAYSDYQKAIGRADGDKNQMEAADQALNKTVQDINSRYHKGAGQQGGGDALSQLKSYVNANPENKPIIEAALGKGTPVDVVLGHVNMGPSGIDQLKQLLKGVSAPNKPEGGTKNNGQNNGWGPKPDVVSKGGHVSPAEMRRVMGVNNPNDVKPKRGLIDILNSHTPPAQPLESPYVTPQPSLKSAS